MDQPCQELKPPLFPQLGNFAKLPPELRFQIWGSLFEDFLYDCHSAPRALSILSCNRYINEETSRILYQRRVFDLAINLHFEKGKTKFTVKMKVRNTGRKKRCFKTKTMSCFEDCLKLLQIFPGGESQTTPPYIMIDCEYPEWDPKRFEIWKNILNLVDTLKVMPNGNTIMIKSYLSENECPAFPYLMPEIENCVKLALEETPPNIQRQVYLESTWPQTSIFRAAPFISLPCVYYTALRRIYPTICDPSIRRDRYRKTRRSGRTVREHQSPRTTVADPMDMSRMYVQAFALESAVVG